MLDRVLGGVCGGIGKYLGIDGWWLRIAFIALALTTFSFAAPAYLVLWVLIPAQSLAEIPPIGDDTAIRYAQPEAVLLLGAGAIAIGIFTLIQINGVLQGFNGDLIAPGMLLVVGLALLIKQIGGRS